MALEQSEAKQLANALANVQRHYPASRILSDKQMALLSLGIVSSRIYGKRAAFILGSKAPGQKRRAQAGAAIAPPPVSVVNHLEGADIESWFPTDAIPPEGHTH